MEIKEYTISDLESLEIFKSAVWPVADMEHYGDKMPDFYKKEITYLAKEGDTILGYVTIIIDSGIAQIEPLMVAVDTQGQGIGTKLISYIEQELKKMNVHKVWLETGATWKSCPFYIKNGYTERCILPNHIANQDFILFDKML
ncbi:MAG: GNAT family N-acetyltransferase [bacterium]